GDPGALLRKHGLRPKKSWGQNFLVDASVYERILAASRLERDDVVVEVGAGLGTLTARLAERAAHVVALERDRDLAAVLRAELGQHPRVEIREQNALGFDYAAEAAQRGRALVVVGNLPYHIATPILLGLVAARAALLRAVV